MPLNLTLEMPEGTSGLQPCPDDPENSLETRVAQILYGTVTWLFNISEDLYKRRADSRQCYQSGTSEAIAARIKNDKMISEFYLREMPEFEKRLQGFWDAMGSAKRDGRLTLGRDTIDIIELQGLCSMIQYRAADIGRLSDSASKPLWVGSIEDWWRFLFQSPPTSFQV
ncbi:hypothetical protein M407DRAFT_12274 [Tulasnella calospora MUT 4182]|uniref:Uncharacterized protein n=1 Tax=Tulasnella calospora MUT 4182 TaxID=1051891 RepID=A0A0C3Q3G8_9AGAM|nr:hypothetical protein M407DRAFT_12274 [Tulasnella calospora MUT 4182]